MTDNCTVPQALERFFSPAVHRLILSNPRDKQEHFTKITIRRMKKFWQAEKRGKQQVFHENLDFEGVQALTVALLGSVYLQCNLWDNSCEYSIRITAGGKVLCGKHSGTAAPQPQAEHNRRKNYLLPEGADIPPLVDMGIFSKEGKVLSAMQDKYRQINRFTELVDDAVKKLPQKKLRVVDFGCGKSYLTFILYYYLTQIAGREVDILGLDLKEDVIALCNEAAQKYAYAGLSFAVGDIAHFDDCGKDVDMVLSLHACDTATDYALHYAIRRGAKLIFCVPCCQHELNGQMESDELSLFTRYGIVRERCAALLTDAIRANLVESCGYQVQLLEFVELAHTPKNILLRAVKTPRSPAQKQARLAQVSAVTEQFHLAPTLQKLLEDEIEN